MGASAFWKRNHAHTNQWIAAGFGASLVVAVLAGLTGEGFSIPLAATTLDSMALGLVLALVWLGLQGETRELALQREELREQREQMAKIARMAQRGAAEQLPDFMYAPEDPRPFLGRRARWAIPPSCWC